MRKLAIHKEGHLPELWITEQQFDGWVDALRSGQYEQTQERLRHADAFCCLGVLCETVDPNAWSETRQYEDVLWGEEGYLAWPCSDSREDTLEWVRHLSEWNDHSGRDAEGVWVSQGPTFDLIADWLEENKEYLEWLEA